MPVNAGYKRFLPIAIGFHTSNSSMKQGFSQKIEKNVGNRDFLKYCAGEEKEKETQIKSMIVLHAKCVKCY
jgi:hypothetical protein